MIERLDLAATEAEPDDEPANRERTFANFAVPVCARVPVQHAARLFGSFNKLSLSVYATARAFGRRASNSAEPVAEAANKDEHASAVDKPASAPTRAKPNRAVQGAECEQPAQSSALIGPLNRS